MAKPVETKVTAASLAAYGGSAGLLAVLTAVQDNPGLVAALPNWVEPFVLAAIPAALTFVSGWYAKHTPNI